MARKKTKHKPYLTTKLLATTGYRRKGIDYQIDIYENYVEITNVSVLPNKLYKQAILYEVNPKPIKEFIRGK